MQIPDRTTAAAFAHYSSADVLADSVPLGWTGMFAARMRFPRVVDRFLVPATAEPLVTCNVAGSAEFCERDPGQKWIEREVRAGDLFVTRSATPYEVCWESPPGQALEVVKIHIAVDTFNAALETVHGRRSDAVEVIDFFGRDPALENLCGACAAMLAERVSGESRRVVATANVLALHLAEKYTNVASDHRPARGGLPFHQLRLVENHVRAHLTDDISIDALATLVNLSPFHFCRVFKQSTGMSPLRFVTRERVTTAQRMIRETDRSLIEIALEVGYTSPSHFAQVFRRVAGQSPTEFRNAL